MDFYIYSSSLWQSFTNDSYSNQILHVFVQHAQNLTDYYQKTNEKIDQWRTDSINRINELTSVQRNILLQDFQLQKEMFEEKRKSSVEKAPDYYQNQNKDLFDQFLVECEIIEFKMAQIQMIKDEVENLTVVTAKELESREQQKEQKRLNTQSNNFKTQGSSDTDPRRQHTSHSNTDTTASATQHQLQ
jgi:hypothetical protein